MYLNKIMEKLLRIGEESTQQNANTEGDIDKADLSYNHFFKVGGSTCFVNRKKGLVITYP